jgi:formate transporter
MSTARFGRIDAGVLGETIGWSVVVIGPVVRGVPTMRLYIFDVLKGSVYAGMVLSIACISFLKNPGVIGAALFSFGLISIVLYELKLYTGVAGFVRSVKDIPMLLSILIGNICGCLIMSLLARYSMPELAETCVTIFHKRYNNNLLEILPPAIFCGLIMTTAVKFAKAYKPNYIPLLLGVPLFVLSGFSHCIADAFYFLSLPYQMLLERTPDIITTYVMIVIGNGIGCNLGRIVALSKEGF